MLKGGTMISNCGHDERNKYTGGKAGDQTGAEWTITNWYDRPWNCILRHPDAKIRAMIADKAEKAAKNDNVGYDMYQRYTFFDALEKAGWDPSKISTPCEADCSSGITAIVRAIGFELDIQSFKDIDPKTYTENMKANFVKAGFNVLTAKKYTKAQNCLLRGDILLNYTKHCATNLTNGSDFEEIQNEPKKSISEVAKDVIAGKYGNDPERSKKLTAEGYDAKAVQAEVNRMIAAKKPAKTTTTYKVTGLDTYLNVRKSPNGAIVGKLYNDNTVEVVSIDGMWAKLDNGNYIYTKYIKKV